MPSSKAATYAIFYSGNTQSNEVMDASFLKASSILYINISLLQNKGALIKLDGIIKGIICSLYSFDNMHQ